VAGPRIAGVVGRVPGPSRVANEVILDSAGRWQSERGEVGQSRGAGGI
jgi:hypothetical protein